MSDNMNARRRNYRNRLLATVSAMVLAGSACGAAKAADSDRPTVWIDLGWHYEHDGGGQEPFAPAFVDTMTANGFTSPVKIENALPWSYGGDGKISYQPQNSDWIFSAAVRYGRALGHNDFHEQTTGPEYVTLYFGTFPVKIRRGFRKYAQAKEVDKETHAILDFQAGKDIGMGLFGRGSTSVLSGGVRYTQIRFGAHTTIDTDPDKYFPKTLFGVAHNHFYSATNEEARSFKGLGPAISWNASAPLIGDAGDGDVALDWGINAGVLFGRQKASGQHQTGTDYNSVGLLIGFHYSPHHSQVVPHSRSKSIVVPNLGGFAGLSLNWTNAKVSVGYRADMFFNAMDGGIDARKSENRSFSGPFASISIGFSPSDF